MGTCPRGEVLERQLATCPDGGQVTRARVPACPQEHGANMSNERLFLCSRQTNTRPQGHQVPLEACDRNAFCQTHGGPQQVATLLASNSTRPCHTTEGQKSAAGVLRTQPPLQARGDRPSLPPPGLWSSPFPGHPTPLLAPDNDTSSVRFEGRRNPFCSSEGSSQMECLQAPGR